MMSKEFRTRGCTLPKFNQPFKLGSHGPPTPVANFGASCHGCPMKNAAKPYSRRAVIGAGLALAIGFLALSVFFLFLQARNNEVRLAGMITAVGDNTVTIRNAHGDETRLIVTPDTKLGTIEEIAALSPGQHIMTRGDYDDADVFQATGIRLIRRPPSE